MSFLQYKLLQIPFLPDNVKSGVDYCRMVLKNKNNIDLRCRIIPEKGLFYTLSTEAIHDWSKDLSNFAGSSTIVNNLNWNYITPGSYVDIDYYDSAGKVKYLYFTNYDSGYSDIITIGPHSNDYVDEYLLGTAKLGGNINSLINGDNEDYWKTSGGSLISFDGSTFTTIDNDFFKTNLDYGNTLENCKFKPGSTISICPTGDLTNILNNSDIQYLNIVTPQSITGGAAHTLSCGNCPQLKELRLSVEGGAYNSIQNLRLYHAFKGINKTAKVTVQYPNNGTSSQYDRIITNALTGCLPTDFTGTIVFNNYSGDSVNYLISQMKANV